MDWILKNSSNRQFTCMWLHWFVYLFTNNVKELCRLGKFLQQATNTQKWTTFN